MTSYVALLRGINVGGNNIIKMADLKACFEKHGFQNVSTYIQSGNVLFATKEANTDKLETELEHMLNKRFSYTGKVLVRSDTQMQKVVKNIPADWKTEQGLRCYIVFLKKPLTASEAVEKIELRKGVDWITKGTGVVYISSLMKKLTKSKINKLTSQKIYQYMTIRNLNTTKKIAEKMAD